MSTPTYIRSGAQSVLVHTRRQHAVGQGGFHTARLIGSQGYNLIVVEKGTARGYGAPSISWIYDCGSQKPEAIDGQVELYLGGSRPRLEFLFVSHLDVDHINGIPRLLRAGDGAFVDTIALPYLDHVERMIVYAKAVADGTAEDRFLQGLVIDPVAALEGFGPRRILFFRSGPERDGEDPDFVPEGPGGEDGPAWKLIGPDRSRPSGRRLSSSAPGVEASVVQDTAMIDMPVPQSGLAWIFKPHVRKADPKKVADFEAAAETKLGWSPGTFRTQVEDRALRQGLVGDPLKAGLLSDAYKLAFKGKNVTTLSVYSGPHPDNPNYPAWTNHRDPGLSWGSHKAIGWLGTGDAELKPNKWCIDFLHRYGPELGRVWTFVLPHHGAFANWNDKLLTFSPKVCVACASPADPSWKHPNPEVVKAVKSNKSRFVHVKYNATSALDEAFIIQL